MTTIAAIPARYASSRLPGKVLLRETGKPLVQHVVESVRSARRIERAIVVTDDARVVQAVRDFGGEAVLTSDTARTGTDRLAEVTHILRLDDDDVIVNIQGDEPEMPPECVDLAADLLAESKADIATLATAITPDEAARLHFTKVVLRTDGTAMYFSRARIPHDRDAIGGVPYYLHHGIYAYTAGFLRRFAAWPTTPAERAEKLEQLRALEHGATIAVALVNYRGARIDTPEEYQDFVRKVREGQGPRA